MTLADCAVLTLRKGCMYIRLITLNGDLAEDAGVPRCDTTVPATVSKLLLTFPDGQMSSVRDACHHVRM